MTSPLLKHLDKKLFNDFMALDALYMATENKQGIAEPSYAPFIESNLNLYVYISELASHTINILKQQYAGILLIEDGSQARNPFARKRLSLHCKVDDIPRHTEEYQQAVKQLTKKYGNTMDVLSTLGDFHLIKLMPQKGTLVEGFGKTSHLEKNGLHAWKKS